MRDTDKSAVLYRMVMDKHTCPYGIKLKDLLEREGYHVDDHHLTSDAQTKAFRDEHDVKTTPQAWVDGQRIGGYDAVRAHFGDPVPDPAATSYRPVLAIFGVAALLALAVSQLVYATPLTMRAVEWFIAISMSLLAVQKLQNVESFSTMFLNYDLLARRWVRYGYIYPYLEAIAGALMVAGTLVWLAGPVALFIGTIGAVSIFKAVYIEKRELKCACVGGGSNVPLGFVSLTESLLMMFMGIWMPLRAFVL